MGRRYHQILGLSVLEEHSAHFTSALKEIEAEDSLWHPRGNEDRRRKHKSEKAATDAAQDGEPDNLSNTKFTQNAGSIPKFY